MEADDLPVSILLFQAMGLPMMLVCIVYSWMPRGVRNEIWWVVTRICYPFAITTITLNAVLGGSWLARICLPFWIILWVKDCKDDHDDRWKKRRKKLLAKVAVKGRRLVVQPVKITN